MSEKATGGEKGARREGGGDEAERGVLSRPP